MNRVHCGVNSSATGKNASDANALKRLAFLLERTLRLQ